MLATPNASWTLESIESVRDSILARSFTGHHLTSKSHALFQPWHIPPITDLHISSC